MTTRGTPGPTCGAKTKKPGNPPCENPPLTGATRCRLHGGASPRAQAAAQERLTHRAAIADAKALLAHEGLIVVDDPIDAIAGIARECMALKNSLGNRVNALTNIRFEDLKGAEQLRSEVALYERALDRTVRVLKVLADLGYQERLVRIDEQIAAETIARMRGVFDDLDLTEDQRAKIPAAVERHFTVLPGGAA